MVRQLYVRQRKKIASASRTLGTMGAAARRGEKMSKQPKDDANVAIPVLSLKPGGGQQLTASGSSVRSSAFSKTTRVITVYAEEDIFVEIGDSTVTANQSTSHYIPGTVPYDLSLGTDFDEREDRFLAVIQVSTGGTVYVSERS